MDLHFHEKDATQLTQHQHLIDFSVLTDAEVTPIVSAGNGSHLPLPMSTVAVSTLPSFHSTMGVLDETMSQAQIHERHLPMLSQQDSSVHMQHNHEPIMVQSNLHHHTSLPSHSHNQNPMQQQQHTAVSQQPTPPQMVELVELTVVDNNAQEGPLQVHEVVTLPNTQTERTISISSTTLPVLEQCSICSANYEKPRRIFPQPDINRLLIKLLDITPATLATNGTLFFSQYLPVCIECSKKVKKYERLRNEMDIIKQDVVSSLTDSFLYIQQPKVGTTLECIKQPFLNRWVNRHQNQNQQLNGSSSQPQITNKYSSSSRKPARVLPTDHFIKPTTSIVQNNGNVKLGPWQLASDLNILTTDNCGTTATERQQYVAAAAYVADVMNPKTGILGSKRRRGTRSPDKQKQKGRNGDNGIEKKQQRQSQSEKVKQHEKSPYFCQNCGRVFSALKSHKYHAAECTSVRTKPAQCTICCADFSESTWLDLKFHIDLAHPDCELDKCRHCRIEFLPNTIDDHECIYESSGNAKAIKPHQEHKCDFCDKTYFHTNSLGNHVRRHHRGEQTLSCDICSRTFTTSAILKSHMKMHKTEPTGKNAHKCEECGIFCSTVWGLKQHKTIHSGERQYQCEHCGKKFRLHQAWRAHEVVHTKERKYSCQICGKLFAQYCSMQRHMKRHINPLPAIPRGEACPICEDARFAKASVLMKHMLRKHPGTKEQLDISSRFETRANSNSKEMTGRHRGRVRKRALSKKSAEKDNEDDEEVESDTGEYDGLGRDKGEGDSDIEEVLEIRRSSTRQNSASGYHERRLPGKPASIRKRLKRNSL